MEFFLDSGSKEEYERWRAVLAGATTNPAIVLKDGCNIREFCECVSPKPVSVEAAGDFEKEALEYSSIPNAVIKVPLLRPDGGHNLSVIEKLESHEIQVNCTALFSMSQFILGARAGASYLSLFIGRVDDEGGDWCTMLNDCIQWLVREGIESKVIVGSVRTVGQVLACANLDFPPDYVTVPPAILEKMVMHRFSLETVKQFEAAADTIKAASGSGVVSNA